jgi:glycosyltransferase involved in cell wall biosynthesis
VPHVDAFLTHSRYYADFMSSYLGIPRDKFRVVPLGIDTRGYPLPGASRAPQDRAARPLSVGYLARLVPEKGLHLLVDAFLDLRQREATRDCRLRIAGWLGESNRPYAEQQFARLSAAGFAEAFEYVGSVDRPRKIEFLQSLDVLSVPTTQREPKGLFVLEALAAGVPVVQPAHGAFPELLERSGGGLLVPPHDAGALADALQQLLLDKPQRHQLGQLGSQAVHRDFNAEAMSRATWAVLEEFL